LPGSTRSLPEVEMMLQDGSTALNLNPSDVHEDYSRAGNAVLGALQIFLGFFSIALGIGSICTWASGYFIGYGIWCGFLMLLAGGIQIGAACRRSSCLIMACMAFALIGATVGFIQMSLGVVAAENDAYGDRRDIPSVNYRIPQWDIFYSKNTPYNYLCAGNRDRMNWVQAWGPVDILLLIVGFFEGVVGTISAILCCRTVCCGLRRVSGMRGVYYQNTGTSGFANEGYMTDPRMSPSPPLYKVM